MRARRFVPSVSLLTAFEAVVRTGTTAEAARTLNLTQGAVSRLVNQLEQQVGVKLFDRHRQRLVSTEAARSYARDVARALDAIERATLELAVNPQGGSLSLSILPAFGTRWLAPRLGRFQQQNPGITLNLATRLKRFNLDAEGFDAAIHFGTDDWRGAQHMKLFDERVTACASRSFVEAHSIGRPADLEALQLFQIESRPAAWEFWFGAHGLEAGKGQGMLFDQFGPMMQAAIAGLGIALLPEYLAAPEIAEERLVPLFRRGVEGGGSYWMVWADRRADYPPVLALKNWLANEVRGLEGAL